MDSLSVDYSWSSFPLSEPTDHFAVRFTQDNVSVMLPVGEHDSSYHIDKLLLPYRDYVFDVVAFTEADKIYSSQSSSVKTPEGGKLKDVLVESLFFTSNPRTWSKSCKYSNFAINESLSSLPHSIDWDPYNLILEFEGLENGIVAFALLSVPTTLKHVNSFLSSFFLTTKEKFR